MLHASISGEFEFSTPMPYVFEGPFKSDIDVQVYGLFRNCISLANVNTQFALHLTSIIENVALHSYNGLPFFQKNLEAYAWLNPSAPIGFFYGIPDAVPDFFFDHGITIGGFVCETTGIPERWVQTCNRFDLIVVPSQFCKTAFINSGVNTAILVVRHGLEPEYKPLQEKQRGEPFVFYNTFNSHSFPGRKSCEELIRCFKQAFAGRSDVQLRLRVQRSAVVTDCLAKYDAASLVVIDEPEDATTGDFAAIYSDVHCTVHPSKGEGFGLIPFQSIACATPVIAPYSTGMTEYLNEDNAMLLRTKGTSAGDDVYYKSGHYYPVDENHLIEMLRYAESHWESEYDKVNRVAANFRETFRWEKVLAEFTALLRALTELKNSGERKELIRTIVRK